MKTLNLIPQNFEIKIENPDAATLLRQAILDNGLLPETVNADSTVVKATRGGFIVTAQAIADVIEDEDDGETSDDDNVED